jgi:hypothetical protein
VTTDQNVADGGGWLLLIYRVPPEPTRLRSTVWRRIKSLGAIYLQNSVAALPASTANERALRKLRREITDMSGTAMLMSCSVLAGEAEVRASFQAARNDELEENEVDLVKLRNWYAKIIERDVFGASGRETCEQSLDKCEQSLEAYAARVYAEEAEGQ